MRVLTRMQKWVDEEPFGPSQICLSSDAEVSVNHPELLVIDTEERDIAVFGESDEWLFYPCTLLRGSVSGNMKKNFASDCKIGEPRQYRLRRPFKPFRICLRDGRRIEVPRRFQVGVNHETRFAGAYDEQNEMIRIWPGDIDHVEDTVDKPSRN